MAVTFLNILKHVNMTEVHVNTLLENISCFVYYNVNVKMIARLVNQLSEINSTCNVQFPELVKY